VNGVGGGGGERRRQTLGWRRARARARNCAEKKETERAILAGSLNRHPPPVI